MRGNRSTEDEPGTASYCMARPTRGESTLSCLAHSSRARWRRNSSSCKSANDHLLLEAFRTLSRGDLEPIAVSDHGHGFPDLSGKGPHLQRQTGVTEADRTVRPEQEGEFILNVLHGAL